jgi:hypothetical protein
VVVALAGVLVALAVILEARVTDFGSANSPFAGRRGTAFVRHGTPFRPLGVNYYNAAGDPEIFQCGTPLDEPDTRLDEQFRRIRAETGANVVRFWAFRSYTDSGTDWRALDRVIRLAQTHDLLLIPVLENQWADCTHGGPRTADWYAGRYHQPDDGYPISYEEYVRRIVARYRDEPAIFAWMLMNEAEAKRPDGSGDPDPLHAFAEQMTRLVKEIDPNHLVALGVIGRGQPGTADVAFERLHAIGTIDLVSYHDYQADQVPLSGAHLEWSLRATARGRTGRGTTAPTTPPLAEPGRRSPIRSRRRRHLKGTRCRVGSVSPCSGTSPATCTWTRSRWAARRTASRTARPRAGGCTGTPTPSRAPCRRQRARGRCACA